MRRLIQKIKCKFGYHVPKIRTIPMLDKYAGYIISCICCYKVLESDLNYQSCEEFKLKEIEQRLSDAKEAVSSVAGSASSSASWSARSAAFSAEESTYWSVHSALSATYSLNSAEEKLQVKMIKEILSEN